MAVSATLGSRDLHSCRWIHIELIPVFDVDEEASGAKGVPLHLVVFWLSEHEVWNRGDCVAAERHLLKSQADRVFDVQ